MKYSIEAEHRDDDDAAKSVEEREGLGYTARRTLVTIRLPPSAPLPYSIHHE